MPLRVADALAEINAEFPGASQASYSGNTSLFLMLCTGYPGITTANSNEVASQTGYSTRPSITFTTSGQTASNVALAVTLGTGATVSWIALVDSATLGAGNVHVAIPMITSAGLNLATVTLASPGVFTSPGQAPSNSTKIRTWAVNSVASGGTNGFNNGYPTGLTQDASVTTAGLSGDTFNVGVNTSSSGTVLWGVDNTQVVAAGNQLSFGTGSITYALY